MSRRAFFLTTVKAAKTSPDPTTVPITWYLADATVSGDTVTSTAAGGNGNSYERYANDGPGLRAVVRVVINLPITGDNTIWFNDTFSVISPYTGFLVAADGGIKYIYNTMYYDTGLRYMAGDVLRVEVWDDAIRFILNEEELAALPALGYFQFKIAFNCAAAGARLTMRQGGNSRI